MKSSGQKVTFSTLAYAAAAFVPALCSFALFRLTRAILRLAKANYIRKHPESRTQWQVMDGEFVRKPLVMPLIMTGSPRWNTHAIIGTIGPFEVRSKIRIDLEKLKSAVPEWFFVIYSHPDHTTAGSVSCLAGPEADTPEFLVPQPGEYVIGARFYHTRQDTELPVVWVDGIAICSPRHVAKDTNTFYPGLASLPDRFYRCLHFYMWAAMRCRALLPSRWIEREFLPVGNPETEFQFGVLEKNEPLLPSFGPDVFRDHSVFVTFYSPASIPVLSLEMSASLIDQPLRAPAACFYLVRIQRKPQIPVPRRASGVEFAA